MGLRSRKKLIMISVKMVRLSKDDAQAIARLHRESITTGFLSQLGGQFLQRLYIAISNTVYSRVFVAVEEPAGIIGVCAGCTDTKNMYRSIVMRHGIQFAVLLLPWAVRLSFLKRIAETLMYPFRRRETTGETASGREIAAELLSIAVDEKFRGKGIGEQLVSEMELYFKRAGIAIYKVVTFSKDDNSNLFYQSCGFTLHRTFVHHGNEMNEYVRQIGGVSK